MAGDQSMGGSDAQVFKGANGGTLSNHQRQPGKISSPDFFPQPHSHLCLRIGLILHQPAGFADGKSRFSQAMTNE